MRSIAFISFLSVVLLSGPFANSKASADEPKRPNVLFIAIDDLRTELGCYGHDYVDSPHLDRFASEGVLFNNHFVQVATCGASRYALLTGQSPWRSKAFGNRALYQGERRLTPVEQSGAQTMPELFRRDGYRTVLIGKISHTPDGKVYEYNGNGDGRPELPLAWDDYATPVGQWKRGWGIFFAYSDGRHREDGHGHIDLMEFTAEKDDDLPDGMMATRAIEKLGELKDRDEPFFMGLGFFKPHLPFVAPRQDWEAMADKDIPAPPHPAKPDSVHWHKSGEFYKYKMPWAKTYPLATKDAITARRAYLACVRYTDRQVGRVLSALDELGLRENTIVVVWGDHGWQLGDSALWGKHTPFERSNRSTLIIRAPGLPGMGTTSDALVETIDLYPTLIDLCNPAFSQTAAPLDGHSLKPILAGQPVDRPYSLSFWKSAVSLRTEQYRLIANMRENGPEDLELYDINESPDPVRNLAQTRSDITMKLRQQLIDALDELSK